jgi:lipid A 4'-phosphatase
MSHNGGGIDQEDACYGECRPRPAWGLALLAGLVAAVVFSLWPGIDLLVSEQFYLGKRTFVLFDTTWGAVVRNIFYSVFILYCLLCVVALARVLWSRKRTFGFGFQPWLYLLLCVTLGPGVLTNVILKEHWGRARPVYVENFGGPAKFTPALVPSSQCASNCSFVSGEASSIYMMLFSLAMVVRRQRRKLLVAGVVGGLAAGFVRISMGGHFFSDVVFAGVFMLLLACLLHWLVFTRFATHFADGGPLHARLAALACRMARAGAGKGA